MQLRSVWIALVFSCAKIFSEDVLTYQSTTGNKVTQIEWVVLDSGDMIQLQGKGKDADIAMECTPGYGLQRYEEKGHSGNCLKISKTGVCLMIESKTGGKEKLKSFKLGKTPWVQDFKFGFQDFLKTGQRKYNFYIVNPKDLDVHEMMAFKEVEEEIEVAGQKYEAQKVKITLTGFKKNFWKAQVWFDTKTQRLIKYRANEGPSTPYTETVLLSVAEKGA